MRVPRESDEGQNSEQQDVAQETHFSTDFLIHFFFIYFLLDENILSTVKQRYVVKRTPRSVDRRIDCAQK